MRNPWVFAASAMEVVIWFFLWVYDEKAVYGWMFLAWAAVASVIGALVINSKDTKEKP